MNFKIENERLRIRRHGQDSYCYEIPELGITSGNYDTAEYALTGALAFIKESISDNSAEIAALQKEMNELAERESEVRERLLRLRSSKPSPVVDLLEQEALCHHAIGMLDYEEDQEWGMKITMVAFYDVGDTDKDGDRDYIVSFC